MLLIDLIYVGDHIVREWIPGVLPEVAELEKGLCCSAKMRLVETYQ